MAWLKIGQVQWLLAVAAVRINGHGTLLKGAGVLLGEAVLSIDFFSPDSTLS